MQTDEMKKAQERLHGVMNVVKNCDIRSSVRVRVGNQSRR